MNLNLLLKLAGLKKEDLVASMLIEDEDEANEFLL